MTGAHNAPVTKQRKGNAATRRHTISTAFGLRGAHYVRDVETRLRRVTHLAAPSLSGGRCFATNSHYHAHGVPGRGLVDAPRSSVIVGYRC